MEKTSDEEIEDEEKEAEEEKDGWAVDAATREARDGPHEGNRNRPEARFFADGVERSGRRLAGKVAPEKRQLIVEPHGEIGTVTPH